MKSLFLITWLLLALTNPVGAFPVAQVAGLASAAKAATPLREPRIVVSFSILEDIVRNLVPSDFKIESAVPAGMDSHGHEPMAKEYLTFKKADLIILAGNNFEPWASRIIEKIHAKASVYYVSQNISLLPLQDEDHHHEAKSKDHQANGFDPHFWQSPEVMTLVISNLSDYLQKTFPGSAVEIKQKTTNYLGELKKLHTQFKQEFSKIPESARQMVIAHNSFQYFAKDFVVRVYSPLDASQEGETSLAQVSKLIKQIQKDKIQSLFLEKSSPESLMKNIAKESGVAIKGVLYSDCLSTDAKADTYLKMLDYNFNLILKSMKGSK